MAGNVAAKTRSGQLQYQTLVPNTRTVQSSARDIEQRLTPFFEAKRLRAGKKQPASSVYLPTDVDMMLLCKAWRSLSPQFKEIYLEATGIPDGFSSYVSVGGHFEIFYTFKGKDAIDSTDTVTTGRIGDWRFRRYGANNIPDYIDEVAWALDSTWSMEIDRFGFVEPIPLQNSKHPSAGYKVVVIAPNDPSFYGMTYPQGKSPGSDRGYSSYLEISNAWPTSVWGDLGYDKHPEFGVRVTCAHEFLHAIQYAMTWILEGSTTLDDYPVSWLEGTAVLMEELAFDSINDYLQYSLDYFSRPTMSFLDQSQDGIIYTNSMLTKFLFERATGSPGIDFIRKVFDRNYKQAFPFHDNLDRTSAEFGTTWVRILNDFHTESYFTGSRSVDDRFLSDARLFPTWSYPTERPVSSLTKNLTIKPYGMGVFGAAPREHHGDTLYLSFTGEPDSTGAAAGRWALSFIARKPHAVDSIISVEPVKNGTATLSLPEWKSMSELLAIVSNGHPSLTRTARIDYEPCPVTFRDGETVRITATASDNRSSAKVIVTATAELRCSMSLNEVGRDSTISLLQESGMSAVSAIFQLSYPPSWNENARIDFELALFTSPEQERLIEESITAIGLFRLQGNSWNEESAAGNKSGDTLFWRISPDSPAIFALLQKRQAVKEIEVYPNPVRLRTGGSVRVRGPDITGIRIYSIDGTLICTDTDSKSARPAISKSDQGFSWRLTGGSGTFVVPGIYMVMITSEKPGSEKREVDRKKILVTP